jgi:hypothetical protein
MMEEYLVPVNLETLFKSIRVAPYMDKWLCETLQEIVSKFAPGTKLISSHLKKSPPHKKSLGSILSHQSSEV